MPTSLRITRFQHVITLLAFICQAMCLASKAYKHSIPFKSARINSTDNTIGIFTPNATNRVVEHFTGLIYHLLHIHKI